MTDTRRELNRFFDFRLASRGRGDNHARMRKRRFNPDTASSGTPLESSWRDYSENRAGELEDDERDALAWRRKHLA